MLPTEYDEFERFLKAAVGSLRSSSMSADTVKIWFTTLRRYSLDDIKKACMHWIEGNDRVPTPAAIKEVLRERIEARNEQPAPVLNVQCAWILSTYEIVKWNDSLGKPREGPRLERCSHFSRQTEGGSHICAEHLADQRNGLRAAAGAFM